MAPDQRHIVALIELQGFVGRGVEAQYIAFEDTQLFFDLAHLLVRQMERILDAQGQRGEGEIVLAIIVGQDLALVFLIPEDFETVGRRTDLVLVVDDAD